MSNINKQIPIGTLDLVRAKILEILSLELSFQFTEYSDDDYDLKYQIEQFTALNVDSMSSLNIRFVNSELKSQDQTGSVYTNTYWAEFYTTNVDKNGLSGSKVGALRLTKILNACRHILKSPVYNRLGLPVQLIGKVTPTDIRVSESKYNQNNQDATDLMYGRLQIEVDCVEDVSFVDRNLIEEYNTIMKMFDSDKTLEFETII